MAENLGEYQRLSHCGIMSLATLHTFESRTDYGKVIGSLVSLISNGSGGD